MTESTEKESAEEREHSFSASFSQGDLRLFLITFAGTVAANILTVMVVAVAVILARPQLVGRPTVGSSAHFPGRRRSRDSVEALWSQSSRTVDYA
jgi:hypothetical protein